MPISLIRINHFEQTNLKFYLAILKPIAPFENEVSVGIVKKNHKLIDPWRVRSTERRQNNTQK